MALIDKVLMLQTSSSKQPTHTNTFKPKSDEPLFLYKHTEFKQTAVDSFYFYICCKVESGLDRISSSCHRQQCNAIYGLWSRLCVFPFFFRSSLLVRRSTNFVNDNVMKIKLYSREHEHSAVGITTSTTKLTSIVILCYYNENNHSNNNSNSSKIYTITDIFVDINQLLNRIFLKIFHIVTTRYKIINPS